MNIKRLIKIIKSVIFFKNPITVINFYRGKFAKGKKIQICPRKGDPFFVARMGDLWLLEKIMRGSNINIERDSQTGARYINIDGIFLREGSSDTFVFKEIFIDYCYKENINKLTPESVVIDIGAHIGLFSIYASKMCKKVFAFEPQVDNYLLAKRNIDNQSIKNIKIFNLAVWSASNKFISMSNNYDGRTGEYFVSLEDKSGVKKQIGTISIHDIFLENNISECDLLKIDIEGAEYASLFSTPLETFRKIKCISMEYHPDLEKRRSLDDLVNLLEKNGFMIKITKINEITGILNAKKINS